MSAFPTKHLIESRLLNDYGLFTFTRADNLMLLGQHLQNACNCHGLTRYQRGGGGPVTPFLTDVSRVLPFNK